MSELATTPGKRLVMPRSSTAGAALAEPARSALPPGSAICHSCLRSGSRRGPAYGPGNEEHDMQMRPAGGWSPPPSRSRRLRGRHLDRAVDDLLLVVLELGLDVVDLAARR